jgi:hypothetical protein
LLSHQTWRPTKRIATSPSSNAPCISSACPCSQGHHVWSIPIPPVYGAVASDVRLLGAEAERGVVSLHHSASALQVWHCPLFD